MSGQQPAAGRAPGFYPTGEVRTQRFWDGQQWVGAPFPIARQLGVWEIAQGAGLGVAAGVVLLVILFGAGLFA